MSLTLSCFPLTCCIVLVIHVLPCEYVYLYGSRSFGSTVRSRCRCYIKRLQIKVSNSREFLYTASKIPRDCMGMRVHSPRGWKKKREGSFESRKEWGCNCPWNFPCSLTVFLYNATFKSCTRLTFELYWVAVVNKFSPVQFVRCERAFRLLCLVLGRVSWWIVSASSDVR